MTVDTDQILHATAVSFSGAAVVITGPSGAGKSGFALQLIALGAQLIADDRVILREREGVLIASCPAPIRGLIEARGFGILNATPAPSAPIKLAIDMSMTETERMPDLRNVIWLGHKVPLLWRIEAPHFPATVLQVLSHGRSTR